MRQTSAKGKRPAAQSGKTTRKHRSNIRRKPAKARKALIWAWIITGFSLTAVLAAVLIHIDSPKPEIKPAIETGTSSSQQHSQPRFDFYEILRQQEVEVPDRSAEIAVKNPQNTRYYLQVGSFRNAGDANQLRAQLLLLNLSVATESIEKDGNTWHRVIVGPFTTRSKVAKARSLLAAEKLNPLLLKR